MAYFGAMCRVAFWSNLALGAQNNVATVELTTPFLVDPDGA